MEESSEMVKSHLLQGKLHLLSKGQTWCSPYVIMARSTCTTRPQSISAMPIIRQSPSPSTAAHGWFPGCLFPPRRRNSEEETQKGHPSMDALLCKHGRTSMGRLHVKGYFSFGDEKDGVGLCVVLNLEHPLRRCWDASGCSEPLGGNFCIPFAVLVTGALAGWPLKELLIAATSLSCFAFGMGLSPLIWDHFTWRQTLGRSEVVVGAMPCMKPLPGA